MLDAGTRVVAGVLVCLAIGCGDDTAAEGGGGAAESGSIDVQISGEEIATEGFAFPEGSEVVLADGWELQFDHVFVTVGRVWLSDGPDTNPGDQSQTGDEVAEANGPWAIDLATVGDRVGAGGEGTAHPLATFTSQNLKGNAPLSTTDRYAFSFSFVGASNDAAKIGFEGDAETFYEEAVAEGYAVYYVGTATFKGDACEVSDASYDFTSIPLTVPVRLGFATPTNYLNCQNEENQGDPFPDEEYQRGIAIRSNQASLAQITVHLEHPFYSDVQHEPAVFFDQIAAQLVGAEDTEVARVEGLVGVDPTGFTDGTGKTLPWRACDGSAVPDSMTRAFEVGSIPVGPGQDPSEGFRDYADYIRYVQSSQGHMNGGEGLCYIERRFNAPQ